MSDEFVGSVPDAAAQLALDRAKAATVAGQGSDMEGLALDQVIVNMGPQHPSTHGVLRLVCTLDGEVIKDVIPVIGYLHRCKEKLAEKRTYFQYIPIPDRTEYVAGMNCEWGYVQTVEKLAGIEPTRRAEFIRVIVAELNRIASHLVAVGTFVADLSPLGTAMVFYMFRDREEILDLLEAVSGARMMFNYFRFGGVRYDLPDGWVERCRDFLTRFPKMITEYESLVETNAIFLQRCIGKGQITQQDVADYAITGPNARASGVKHDLRRTRPYSVYPELEFDLPLGEHGDVFDRYKVRMDEMRESAKIINQCLDMLPKGPVQVGSLRPPYVITPPPGNAYTAQENPRGEYGTYIVSDGSRYPYRLKYRDPCFCNLQIFPKLLRGEKIADAIAISGSIDLVLGGIDR
ncbi:MAG: NADH-quinone oxidoreductase subunit D [Thermoleophilia bacterium]